MSSSVLLGIVVTYIVVVLLRKPECIKVPPISANLLRKRKPDNLNNWMTKTILSYDVASGDEITTCNKICKPLVVYRFTGNVMTSITTLRT